MSSIYLSELFPNPAGKDTGNEWIEVCNKGTQAQSLTGWKLQDASTKSFTIGDVSLAPQSCVVFGNTQTKISLNNDKETISLFDANGVLVDLVSYSKAVKDNQALARIGGEGELQVTTIPTKGEIQNSITQATKNNLSSNESKIESNTTQQTTQNENYITGSIEQKTGVLVSGTSIGEVILIGVCVAGVLAVVFMKIVIQLKTKNKD